MRNVRLVLEYDGSAYLGWQRQAEGETIQGHRVRAVEAVTGNRPVINATGRTDAGVHALAQVANFQTEFGQAIEKLGPAINSHLPPDIRVHGTREAPLDFKAKRDSKSKIYRYQIYEGPIRPPLLLSRAWHLRGELNIEAMHQASRCLLGDGVDFESFRSVHCQAEHARRDMLRIEFSAEPRPPTGRNIYVTLHANAYCQHMCRIIVGTLAEVGQNKRTVQSVHEALHARDRTQTGITAPAYGLTLMEVRY